MGGDDTQVTYVFGVSRRQIDAWRKGAGRYTLWLRGQDDPERQTPGMRGAYGVDPHHTINRMDPGRLEGLIWSCLSAHPGAPMTFNELSVRLFDLGADVTGDTALEHALWTLIEQGCVALTQNAPILLLRTCDPTDLSRPAPAYTPRMTPTQTCLF